jgi:hypothetical protein
VPSYIYRDGEMVEVSDTIISTSCEIREPITNTVVIKPGVHVTAFAPVSGTVNVGAGASLDAHDRVGGTVHVAAGASAVFRGSVGGTLDVGQGGHATLTTTAVALGTMHIEGELTNEGVRGVQVHGRGTVSDMPGSTVRQPDEVHPDGTFIYHG